MGKGEGYGDKTPYPFSLSCGMMEEMKIRIYFHVVCLFKNPKAWRFYLAGIFREFFK